MSVPHATQELISDLCAGPARWSKLNGLSSVISACVQCLQAIASPPPQARATPGPGHGIASFLVLAARRSPCLEMVLQAPLSSRWCLSSRWLALGILFGYTFGYTAAVLQRARFVLCRIPVEVVPDAVCCITTCSHLVQAFLAGMFPPWHGLLKHAAHRLSLARRGYAGP